jgi:hypothetical protein
MNKKLIALILAIASTVISVVLWFWYASIPSFQSSEKTFSELQNETFQSQEIPK